MKSQKCKCSKLSITNFQISKFEIPKFLGAYTFQRFHNFRFPDLQKSYVRQCFHIFLYVVEYFGIFKSINKGSPGLKNAEIMKMLGFGPSHNKIGILSNQN